MTLGLNRLAKIIIFVLFTLLLLFSRFYNLDNTARFVWDESSDLVRMRQIYQDKNLTLIGPISEDGNKVFGSISYYMFLPFTILGNFDPISPVIGAAFWGVLTVGLLAYLVFKVNKKILYLALPVLILWYPLVETGRWAWNPNLIPFWVSLSLIFLLRKGDFSKFVSGLFMGLALHLHYLSIFAGAGLAAVLFIKGLKEKKFNDFLAFFSGMVVSLLPFVIFDLSHPPGLFLSRILYFNYLGGSQEGASLLSNGILVVSETFKYFTQSELLKYLLLALTVVLIFWDLKVRSKALPYIAVFVFQLLGVTMVKNFYPHYILAALPFFVLYLIYPRKRAGKIFSYLSLAVILVSSIISFPKQITKVTWEGNIAATRQIAGIIEEEVRRGDLKNVNLAVLASEDPNIYGRRYRDLLLLKGVNLRTKEEYQITDALFVITTANSEALRADPGYEMNYFRNGPLVESWEVPDSEWKVFLFSRPI